VSSIDNFASIWFRFEIKIDRLGAFSNEPSESCLANLTRPEQHHCCLIFQGATYRFEESAFNHPCILPVSP
jgi:hypothetical protein